MKAILLLALILALTTCAHLPDDPTPNPSVLGFHRLEFDTIYKGNAKKEIGISNVNLQGESDLDNYIIRIYLANTGKLYVKSVGCSLDYTANYTGIIEYKLKDIINTPKKCTIDLVAEADKINGKEHVFVMSGQIKINTTPSYGLPLTMRYVENNGLMRTYRTYEYQGQGSKQRREGALSGEEVFELETPSNIGQYRVVGCGHEHTGKYNTNHFSIRWVDIYRNVKDKSIKAWFGNTPSFDDVPIILDRTSGCDFEIITLPEDGYDKSYYGRISLSIFGKEVVKLEPMQWKIEGNKIKAVGRNTVFGCSINELWKNNNACEAPYEKGKEYWIRAVTVKANFSIFMVKDGEVMWKE